MTKRIKLYTLTALLIVGSCAEIFASSDVKLVVNIVVSGMRSVDMQRYQENFGSNGLRKLYDQGVRYDNCQYSYQQTTTPVSLATLSTGSQPSTHGIVGHKWYDYVTNEPVKLSIDYAVRNLEYTLPFGGYSAHNMLAPTISETLLGDSPESKAVTVALDPSSAILLSGKSGEPFWFDEYTCSWATSDTYMDKLPSWAINYNKSEADISLTALNWVMSQSADQYINSRYSGESKNYQLKSAVKIGKSDDRATRHEKYHSQIISTPIGNDAVAAFAKLAIESLELGLDDNVDIINICFDASRYVVESYGPDSIEAEDMYYKLDQNIADIIQYIDQNMYSENVVYVLSSDHGTSPAVDQSVNRFNYRQFEVILNGFLSVRYGNDSWVLGCENGAVYLNHNAIYQRDINLAEMQQDVATFALQVQGVSHAMTSTALSSTYFGSGYAQKIQTGFYPRRSGDVVLSLMPHWIERDQALVSQSGSMYNYDRMVPLIIYNTQTPAQVISRSVDAVDIAPTLAKIMRIAKPAASEGDPLMEMFE